MAESQFLKWQDKNGDGLNDVCKIVVKPKEVPLCPECKPNVDYVAPNWKHSNENEPWFNEKHIVYQITVVTKESKLIPFEGASEGEAAAHVQSLFKKYEDVAMENLLANFEKADSEVIRASLREVIEYQKYYLSPNYGSRVLLLYGVVCEEFIKLPALPASGGEDDDSPPTDGGGNTTVKYKGEEIFGKVLMFRKSMHLYNRYHKVYKAIQKGSLVQEDGKVFTPRQMDQYGDMGFGKSTMKHLLYDLDAWLNQKGFNLPGFGSVKGAFGDRILDIEFTFNENYRLRKVRIWSVDCNAKPTIFGAKKLKKLKSQPSWKDQRACAYFTKLDDMEVDISAREPLPWIEFIEKHTYPKVKATENYGVEQGALSCVGEALKKEGKALGQDILDDVFSIGDAIAYAFNKQLCYKDEYDVEIMREKLGIVSDESVVSLKPIKGNFSNIYGVAMAQAFEQLENSDALFVEVCRNIAEGKFGANALGAVWKGGFDLTKLCGFKAMTLDVINCLMNGLTLEQALGAIIKSALKGLSIKNFGDLFVGLPPEKQQELDALVKKKIEQGDVFKDSGNLQAFSDIVADRPWDDDQNKDKTVKDLMEGKESSPDRQSTDRTLAEKLDPQSAKAGLNKGVIFEAYILALIEVYSEDLLSLVDRLNNFPGVPLLKKVLAAMDCPRPPVFQPNFMDFIKSVDIPFCTDITDLTLPQVQNPFEWIPKFKDISALIFDAVKLAIQKIIIAVIVKIMVKLCQLLGDAICKALATVGKLAAGLPDMIAGRTTVSDIVKESLCGPGSSDEKVDDTIADMFAKFGVGGAAFADQEAVIALMGDVSAGSTRTEIMEAFLGDMSMDMAMIMDNLIEYEYPQFREGLPNRDAIGDLFADMGNLFPADVKNAMQNFLNDLPEDDFAPANPSLCATPEQLEEFCSLRADLLGGRATPGQAREMCETLQDDFLEDLEDLSNILSNPLGPLQNALPPIVSPPGSGGDDPDCVPGLIPFESDEAKKAAAVALGGDMSQLEVAFTRDMIGNGPGERNWGMVNMILSDTMGKPLTAHWRNSSTRLWYMDFITEVIPDPDAEAEDDSTLPKWLMPFSNPPPVELQYGAYPSNVAGHLQNSLSALTTDFSLTNDFQPAETGAPISFKDLGIKRGKTSDPNTTKLSDMGYNIDINIYGEAQEVSFTALGRKRTPDISLAFADRNKGRTEQSWMYGFNIEMYLADLGEKNGVVSNISKPTMPEDATRIKITDLFNLAVPPDSAAKELMTDEQLEELKEARSGAEADAMEVPAFEFLSRDDLISSPAMTALLPQLSSFTKAFEMEVPKSPLVYLLSDLLSISNGNIPSDASIESFINETMESSFGAFKESIATNPTAFLYGAQYDDIPPENYEYVVGENDWNYLPETLYSDVKIPDDEGGTRRLRNRDAHLGVSRDQLVNPENTRVYYLHPATYGGLYIAPPMYIKPVKNEGWMGMVEVLFPEFTPCKPKSADVINFQEIDDAVSTTYNNIPEDQRLQGSPDCIYEAPYNRVLERGAKAGLEGLIKSACRIYACAHFIKSLATFTTFYPKFSENYSNIYAQYIVENMENSFKDAQSSGWDFLNPFKNNKFWYGFLEQSVQTYGRLVDSGQIVDPPQSVLQALFRLNDAQSHFDYAYRGDLRSAKKAKEIRLIRTLRSYRGENNLEAVQATEEDAKLVLKEFVRIELNILCERFVINLENANMQPSYSSIKDYFLMALVGGASGLTLSDDIKEEIASVTATCAEGEDCYSPGGQFALPDGSEFRGYFHRYEDEDGNESYMAGPHHTEEDHETLTVMANIVHVPIGSVDPIGNPGSYSTKFALQCYTSVTGHGRLPPTDATAIITANGLDLNISDVYPGTMTTILDPVTNKVVGIEGELGVRHGLEFSAIIGGKAYVLTRVEIDALDVTIGDYAPLAANTKLLLCLINHLKEDPVFQLCTEYVIPLNKITAMLAIYNDMGLLPSIGEITAGRGDTFPTIFPFKEDEDLNQGSIWRDPRAPNWDTKPGERVSVAASSTGGVTVTRAIDENNPNKGWTDYDIRNRGWSPFVTTYDEWDRMLLRNCKTRIKRLFRTYYNSRDFDSGERNKLSLGKLVTGNLRKRFKKPPGRGLPWFWRLRLRPNPFNANGDLCEENE